MMLWNTYGKWVKIAAGLSILGGLWHTIGPGVRGEDWAEARGALHERSTIPFLFGTDAPGARATVTNIVETTNYVVTVTVTKSCDGTVLYRQSPDTLVFNTDNWDVEQDVQMMASGEGECVVHLGSDDADNSVYDIVYYASAANDSQALVGDHTGSVLVTDYDEISLMYTHVSVVKVRLREPPVDNPYVSSATTNITEIYEDIDTVNPGLVWDQTYPVLQGFRTLMQTEGWLEDSSAFATAAEGYIFEAVGVNYVVTNDVPYTVTPPEQLIPWYWVDGEYDSYPLATNVTTHYTFPVMWKDTSNITVRATFAALDTVITNESGAAAYHFPADSGDVSALTLVYPSWDTGPSPVIPVLPSGLFNGKGSWWIASGMHTQCVWTLQSSEFYTNGNFSDVHYNKGITTNKHNDIKRMAEALKYTVRVCYPDEVLQLTNSYRVAHEYLYASTGVWTAVTGPLLEYSTHATAFTDNVTTSRAPSFTAASWGSWSLDAETVVTSSEYTDAVTDDPCTWETEWDDEFYGPSTSTTLLSDGWESTSTEVKNAVLNYPSVYAITNGYVKKVRVYAVTERATTYALRPYRTGSWSHRNDLGSLTNSCGDTLDPPFVRAGYYTESVSVTSYPDTDKPDSHMADDNVTLRAGPSGETLSILTPSPWDIPAGFPAHTGTSASRLGLAGHSRIKANLILSVDNPDSPEDLAFDISGPSPYAPTEVGSFQTGGYDETYENLYVWVEKDAFGVVTLGDLSWREAGTVGYRRYLTSESVSLLYFIVVVDWKWEHYGETPFVPSVMNSTPVWRDQ